jgi:hypothetical protein
MSNVVRLVNGGAIQVRTGVLQGIGPQGPTGVAGPQGIDGPQGPVGEQGEMGQILQLMGKTTVGTNNPIAATTDTTMAFGSVSYDDLSCFTSTSNITLTAAGDYLLSCWLRFDDAAAGSRELWFATGGVTIVRSTRQSVPGAPFYIDLAYPYRAVGGEVVNVFVRAGAATAISLGALNVTRVGSGPPGPVGLTGPQGSIGATGAAGPPGPSGTANSGFTKYGDLLPH